MANAENFGMMDGAYFVSRTELLDWLNGTLRLSYTKVEQCCTGAAHCQVLDSMHPGKVQLHKVNFDAKLEHEYITNFKVLQSAFTAVGIKKMIEIEKLVKGKYQDNLEFLQWMKRFADAKMPNGPTNYDPVAVRESAVATQRRLKQPRKNKGTKEPTSTRKEGGTPPVSPEHDSDAAERSQRSQPPPLQRQQQQPPAQEEQRLSDLEASKTQRVLETLEAERDFYYSKLRQIEILCIDDDSPVIPKSMLRTILYSLSENFEPPPSL